MIRWAMQLACIALLLFGTAAAATPYHITLLCGRDACSLPVQAEAYPYARLMTYVSQVRLAIEPAPASMPHVTWHVSDPSVLTLTSTNPFVHEMALPGDTAVKPLPDELQQYLMPGHFEGSRIVGGRGAATVTAEIGPPVNERISFPVFAYRSLQLGCYFNSVNGVSLATNRSNLAPSDADLYVTGPTRGREPFGNCASQYAAELPYTLHAPLGATLIATSNFQSVTPSEWRNDFTEKPLPLNGGVLLVKTRGGAIAKMQVQDEQGSIEGSVLLSNGDRFGDNGMHAALTQTPLRGATRAFTGFRASIIYSDPITSTYGTPKTIVAEMPWKAATSLIQTFGSVGVEVKPRPYTAPSLAWSIDGTTASVTERGVVRGIAPGRSILRAHVVAPVNQTLSIPVVTYDTLVLPCRRGVRFQADGSYVVTETVARSDVFLTCHGIEIPAGGTMLVNGGDTPQFPEISPSLWRREMTDISFERYRALIEPCMVPAGAGVIRADPSCTKRPAKILLFRTRDGHYVKWLLQAGNGVSELAGPYEVL